MDNIFLNYNSKTNIIKLDDKIIYSLNITNINKNSNKNENFSSINQLEKQLEKQIENIEYCSNPVYKTIIFLILVGILIFFIWFVSRKRYFEDNEYNDISTSTPFNK